MLLYNVCIEYIFSTLERELLMEQQNLDSNINSNFPTLTETPEQQLASTIKLYGPKACKWLSVHISQLKQNYPRQIEILQRNAVLFSAIGTSAFLLTSGIQIVRLK